LQYKLVSSWGLLKWESSSALWVPVAQQELLVMSYLSVLHVMHLITDCGMDPHSYCREHTTDVLYICICVTFDCSG